MVDKLYAAVSGSYSQEYPKERQTATSVLLRAMSSSRECWPLSGHENDRLSKYGGGQGAPSRDLVGYGPSPSVTWPKGAKVALSFVINYEEGGESCILHGDGGSEWLLSDLPEATPLRGQRNLNMESLYEYGSRAGFWRLHRLFTKRKVPVTVFAVGMALERNPAVCHALREQTVRIIQCVSTSLEKNVVRSHSLALCACVLCVCVYCTSSLVYYYGIFVLV